MALETGDIIEIGAYGAILGQETVNIFHYRVVVTGSDITDYNSLVDAWAQVFCEEFRQFQAESFTWTSRYVQNLTNGLDFGVDHTEYPGTAASPAFSTFAAYGFKLQRSTTTTRNGRKRIAGVTEGVVSEGQWVIDPADKLIMENLLSEPMELPVDASVATLFPVIVGRDNLGQYDLTRVNGVAGAQLQAYVTTQNSRKVQIGH